METSKKTMPLEELGELLKSALVAFAQETARLAKSTNTPLIRIDDVKQPASQPENVAK